MNTIQSLRFETVERLSKSLDWTENHVASLNRILDDLSLEKDPMQIEALIFSCTERLKMISNVLAKLAKGTELVTDTMHRINSESFKVKETNIPSNVFYNIFGIKQ